MKRFYVEVTAAREGDGYAILLEVSRCARLPGASSSYPPSGLAEAIASEWAEQLAEVEVPAMRLTRLATTVVDHMPACRADAVAEATGYGATDLLCYRATGPAELVARQSAAWQRWLDWAERRFDARLLSTAGVMPARQEEVALHALHVAVGRLDDWRLVGLHAATAATGSVVLGLAIEDEALGADQAFAAALLDELYEIEQWGEDSEQAARHARLRADLIAAERFLGLLRQRA